MPSTISLYPLGCLHDASVYSATSETDGYPKERLLDFNPSTFWRPTSTAQQTIQVELGAYYTVDAVGLLIHNHGDLSGSYDLDIDFWYSAQWNAVSQSMTYNSANFINVIDLDSSVSASDIKFKITQGGTAVDVAQVLAMRKYTPSVGNTWPEDDAEQFKNTVLRNAYGNIVSWGGNDESRTAFTRHCVLPSNADWVKLNAAFTESRGTRLPLIIKQDSDYKLVRFTQDILSKNEIDYQYYDVTVGFEEQVRA